MAADSTPMPLQRPAVHRVLRTATQEAGRLVAMIAGYGALIGLFALAALAVWGELPTAAADSQLWPDLSTTKSPPKLRGSL